ncbi:hypothetical protein AB6A40_005350 [Gnathostoma spinigerum]|uniref:Uncharacterized protein n=1 Tax=Gnathostoma spinigerum TaxID=75299 RepID=A0ABD6EMI6_9BILA
MSSGTSVSQQEKMRRKHCTSSLELSLRGRGKLGKYHKLTANKKDFLSENIDAKNQRASKFRKRCVTFNESTPKRRHRTIADQEIIANSNSIIDHPRNRLAIKSPSSHQNSSQIDCESGHHCVFRAASSGCCDSDANELCDSDFPVSRATARRKLWGFSTPESGDRSAVAQTNPSSRFHRSPLPSSSTSSKQSRSLCSKHNSSRERDQRKPSSSSDSFDTLDEEDEVSDDDWNANEGWKKRKNVYFVSDGENRPTEMFRTDLVHRMKMDEQDAVNSIDEEDLVRMEDRWRQEWSKGVQVNQSKRVPNPVQEDHPCSSDIKETHRSAIKLTAKYNWTHFKKYVDHSVKPHKPPRKMHYQCDGQDLLYLKRLNELRVEMSLSPISEKLFGHLLDEFEVDCYMRIHHDLLSSLTEPREFAPCHAEYDEDACCDICRQPDFEADDAIVFCDGCNLSVHQSCYGIDNLPEDEWMCQVCLLTGYQTSPACVLCPVTGGAMKVTKRGQWAHIVCALWIPEVRFEDVNHREPITNISDIPDERWMFRCSVCDTKQGACIQCTVSNCSTAFHVSCAFRNNQVMRIEHESTNDDVVRLVSLCERHSRISRSPTKTSFAEVRDADDPRHPVSYVPSAF